jgi:hypothetical protein
MTIVHDIPGLDEPVPYTLTPKAHAFFGREEHYTRLYAAELAALAAGDEDQGPGEYEWECTWCGSVWFGTAPDDQTCDACREDS